MNILIVGHACAPLGSEPGFTWNWAWQMSLTHQVWVIAHPEFKEHVDRFLASHPNDRIKFLWVVTNSRFDYWTPGVNQERGIRLHYWLWMKAAYKAAVRLHEEVQLDLVHHVSWSTIAVAPPFWKLPVPAVWGPVGGGQTFPPAFVSHLRQNRIKELLRSLNLLVLPFSFRLRRSLANNPLVLATNLETKHSLERAGARRVGLFLDCGVEGALARPDDKSAHKELTLLWAGRIEPQKGLSIALRAMALCKHRDITLLVAGSGGEQAQMEHLSQLLGVTDRVKFLGRVPHGAMKALFQQCDALVFTSLRDSFGSVVLEAMSNGLPVIALNHQGVGAFVPDDAAIKVPVTSPQQVIKDLADAFLLAGSNPELLPALAKAAFAFAESQTWKRRAETMNGLYTETMNESKVPKLGGRQVSRGVALLRPPRRAPRL